jgi:hypothetical protein
MNPHSYAHLIFDKATKNIQWKKTPSSANVAGKSDYLPKDNSNLIHACHPVLVKTQSVLRTLISDKYLAVNPRKSREYPDNSR